MTIPVLANVAVTLDDAHVATVELHAGPLNFLSVEVMEQLGAAWAWADATSEVRAILLCSEGKVFCGGVDFRSMAAPGKDRSPKPLYDLIPPLLHGRKPCIAAVQGAAVGGGLGLAMLADQRVAGPKAQFNASFALLGFHAGFGLTATLPHVIGHHATSRMLLAGQPVGADEAVRLGLADIAVSDDSVREAALERARLIAANAPRAVQDMRQTLRAPLLNQFDQAIASELSLQLEHMQGQDFIEGISALFSRRPPHFTGT